jgi:hypothetical protein
VDHNAVVHVAMLTPTYLESLEVKLRTIGIHASEDLLHSVVVQMEKLQMWAKELNVPFSSHRIRYYLKRVYLAYLRAWPWYGFHFFEGTLVERVTGHGDLRVVISVGSGGLFILEPGNWSVIFHAQYHDIERCSIETPSLISQQAWSTSSKMLNISINGMELKIVSSVSKEIKSLLEAFVVEILGRGVFPHGTEGGDDIGHSQSSAVIKSTDAKVLMEDFANTFPGLPAPPVPPVLQYSQLYFEAPRSQRQILAEKRAEREMKEREEAERVHEASTLKLFTDIDDLRTKALASTSAGKPVDDTDERDRMLEDEEALQGSSVIRRKPKKKALAEAQSLRDRAKAQVEIMSSTHRDRLDAASRGISLTTSLIISDEDDPRNVHQQAIHAQLFSFTNAASYPLLSDNQFSQQMRLLDPVYLPPVNKAWPSDPIGEDLAESVTQDSVKPGLKVLLADSDSEDDEEQISKESLKEPGATYSERGGWIANVSATLKKLSETKFQVEKETIQALLTAEELNKREQDDELQRLIAIEQEEAASYSAFWNPTTRDFSKQYKTLSEQTQSSMDLFFSSSWYDEQRTSAVVFEHDDSIFKA